MVRMLSSTMQGYFDPASRAYWKLKIPAPQFLQSIDNDCNSWQQAAFRASAERRARAASKAMAAAIANRCASKPLEKAFTLSCLDLGDLSTFATIRSGAHILENNEGLLFNFESPSSMGTPL